MNDDVWRTCINRTKSSGESYSDLSPCNQDLDSLHFSHIAVLLSLRTKWDLYDDDTLSLNGQANAGVNCARTSSGLSAQVSSADAEKGRTDRCFFASMTAGKIGNRFSSYT